MSVLRLAIPSPLRRHFDYLPPADMTSEQVAALQPGTRLRVPFGRRELTGYLLGTCDDSDAPLDSLKPALAVLDSAPLLDERLLALCRWAAGYYHHPIGEVFSHLFPKRLREGQPLMETGTPAWQLGPRGAGLPMDNPLPRSPRQSQAITLLRQGGTMATSALTEAGISSAVLRQLRDKELIEACTVAPATSRPHAHPGLALNEEQAQAVQALQGASGAFSCHLLEGVTGSGKTEVYLQLIAHTLEQGQQALVLIPEIGLTPQTLRRFEERFDANIAVLHSGLGDSQRCRAWQDAQSGRADIVIGTRSAVFTPLPRPGLIIVDEEHDSSYKQQDGFRYSARDIAIKRAQLSDCPVLLGSATPSLESLHNASLDRYQLHQLQQRAGSAQMPDIQVIDVRRQALSAGMSQQMLQAVQDTLARGEQALLFLNRRGFAPTLQCHDCGWIAECRACDARLTVHRRQRHLRCHHCGWQRALPAACENCNSTALATSGLGTEQAEGVLAQHFPQWPIHRVDSDSMKGRDAMDALVSQINRGQPCILLGTQMLTKGHHFPNVSLVAVIDADAMLFSADFRGEERMAQLLTQVAGRAGRAERAGTVIVQTHYPDHPVLCDTVQQGYARQARALLESRRAAHMPPAGHLVMLRTDCADAAVGEDFLYTLRNQAEPGLAAGATLIGPLPAPMQRRAGKFRCQLLLQAPDRARAQAAAAQLVAIAEQLPARSGLKWTIDIDPLDLF